MVEWIMGDYLASQIMDELRWFTFVNKQKQKKVEETSFSKMYLKNMYEESRHTII